MSWTLWSRYAFGILSIVALLLANHFASAFSLASGAQDEELINISGRQRMLSQRILFLSERYVITGAEADLAQLSAAVQLFATSHDHLAEVAAGDPRLAALYEFGRSSGLDERARAYVLIARDIASGAATSAVTAMQVETLVRMGRDTLLGELNAAVSGFETVANNRSRQLKTVQNVTLAMALFIVFLEFLLIFRPLNRWVVQTVRRLDRDANFDALTGLENRRRFTEGLTRQIAARPAGSSVVVVALDLDGFKAVNDVLGHPAGDDVLRYVAQLLKEETAQLPSEEPALVSRLGGDEFFVSFIVETSVAVSATEAFGTALIERLKDPVPISLEAGDEQCIVGVSMGFVTLWSDGALIDTVLADADIALYASKRAGKGRITRFLPEMRDAAVSRLHRETELRRGLLEGEFEPFFQPQIDMETGAFAGFEALARWRHPVRGLLTPDKFLSDAEETNVMNAIEGGLIFKALDFMAQMKGVGLDVPNMSINVSEHSLRDDNFVENLLGTCAMLGVAPGSVTVEILETLTTEGRSERPLHTIKELVRRGFNTAIDDFGTGYSSLAAVSSLEVQALKVDKSLVFQLGEARVEKVLVATIGMAKGMGVKVVAEGVETQRSYDALRAMGCDIAQGYLVGEPMETTDARAWLESRRAAEALPRVKLRPA